MEVRIAGRVYRAPEKPTVVICLDGSDPSYVEDALAHAEVPTLRRWAREGHCQTVLGAMPSFTNPNNVSILTGAPPSIHGICGNHIFDEQRGVELPLDQRDQLWCPTILEELSKAGLSVWCFTAKAKLAKLIAPSPSGDHTIHAEAPGALGRALAGYEPPPIYSLESSLFTLDLAVGALRRGMAELIYVSTTDYVQHKHAPGSEEARRLYVELDRRLQALESLGALVALTADHGMNDKTLPDGSPKVVYLAPHLPKRPELRVVLPITDPYVRHHGALGSCAWIHGLGPEASAVRARLQTLEGIERVMSRDEAARELELPKERIGELVVLGDRHTVLGRSEGEHELSEVRQGLRSHGGLAERKVPLILSQRSAQPARFSYDLFDLVLNDTRR